MAQKSKHYIRAETDMKNLGIYKPEFDSMIAVYAQLMTSWKASTRRAGINIR